MVEAQRFRQLERVYSLAPCNRDRRFTIRITAETTEIEWDVSENDLHGGGAVHGGVLFRLLDDACFFASNAAGDEHMLVTASFTIYFVKPVTVGRLRARGRVMTSTGRTIVAEGSVFDADGAVVAQGMGSFVKSPLPIRDLQGWS